MDLEQFPSGKFDTNELVLELAMPVYNILRMIGDESIGPNHPMKHPVKRRRTKPNGGMESSRAAFVWSINTGHHY